MASSSPPVFVVYNPAAGRGRGRRRIDVFRRLLRKHLGRVEEAVTTGVGQEGGLVDQALSSGFERIVAVGGDGTWSNVANRILESGRDDLTLGLLAGGTGNDFGKTLGITYKRSEEVVRAIAAGRTSCIDVGKVGGRHFLNVVGFGFDIAVIVDSHNVPILKGDALYRFCAMRQLFRFPGLPLEVATEGNGAAPIPRRKHLMLIVANARYFGGSFHIAPRADLHDGKLDLVAIRNARPLARMRLFDLVSRGKHAGAKEVEIRQVPRLTIRFEGPLQYEVDGELCSCAGRELKLAALPEALNVFVPEAR